jgi:hypothetical protein
MQIVTKKSKKRCNCYEISKSCSLAGYFNIVFNNNCKKADYNYQYSIWLDDKITKLIIKNRNVCLDS